MIVYLFVVVEILAQVGRIPNRHCSDGYYVGSQCDKYFRCSGGYQYLEQSCPGNLLFNSHLALCDDPSETTCSIEDYSALYRLGLVPYL